MLLLDGAPVCSGLLRAMLMSAEASMQCNGPHGERTEADQHPKRLSGALGHPGGHDRGPGGPEAAPERVLARALDSSRAGAPSRLLWR
jgi:hypothetical protein